MNLKKKKKIDITFKKNKKIIKILITFFFIKKILNELLTNTLNTTFSITLLLIRVILMDLVISRKF